MKTAGVAAWFCFAVLVWCHTVKLAVCESSVPALRLSKDAIEKAWAQHMTMELKKSKVEKHEKPAGKAKSKVNTALKIPTDAIEKAWAKHMELERKKKLPSTKRPEKKAAATGTKTKTMTKKKEEHIDRKKRPGVKIPKGAMEKAWAKHMEMEMEMERKKTSAGNGHKQPPAKGSKRSPAKPLKISKAAIEKAWAKHMAMGRQKMVGKNLSPPNQFDPKAVLEAFQKHRASKAQKLLVTPLFLPPRCKRRTRKGDHISFKYTGKIDKGSPFGVRGKVFDQGTFICKLGNGEVIDGMDTGLTGTCLHEKREIIVPSHLGYGDNGAGPLIPGGATLHFEIELLHID